MTEREQTIAFDRNYCQHYTPDTIFGYGGQKRTGLCAAGVKYDDVHIAGSFHPCIGGHELENAVGVCKLWARRTMEQAEARANAVEESDRRMRLVMPAIRDWRKKPWGKAAVIDCPACKGRLHLSQAAYNGHVHGRCETAGCVNWME